MAREPRLVGEGLLGMSQGPRRPPNTFSLARYLMIAMVVIVGGIYAAPNLFQPDPAIQIRPEGATADAALLDQALTALREAGITAKQSELIDGGAALIRFANEADQLPGQAAIISALNAERDTPITVALNRAPTTPQWLADIGGKPMSLGLDLSGGVHFLLQVDMDKFLGDRLGNVEEALRVLLRENSLRYVPGGKWVQGQVLEVPMRDEEMRDAALALIPDNFDGYQAVATTVGGNPGMRIGLIDEKRRELEDFAISQNLQSLRNRVNELGVSEPQVQRLGRERIVLDLPGIQDPARAKEIINKFANLDFRLVARPDARRSATEDWEYEGRTVTLLRSSIVTGNNVTNAVQNFDPETQQPQVSITLDNEGGNQMNDATRDNVGNSMAIIFREQKPRQRTVVRDGEEVIERFTTEEARLINVATIQSALGFNFRITGLELGEARDLALLLRAGALAAPMYIVEERTVGASLGEANIRQGTLAVQVGFVLVMIFMLIYYRGFGLAANVALAVNLVLITAVMSLLGATLTMPGIAGIVLTVGMAVDANVLIFSRIREELKERQPQQAIQAGFDRAFVTILDANITTFFVAIILFSVGSGPVRGFAVTLAVGIVTSMFTAILGTRALVNLMYGGRKLESIRI
ncbi:MAG: protein translocase subunit SecD [Pseudomonadota bacterium]